MDLIIISSILLLSVCQICSFSYSFVWTTNKRMTGERRRKTEIKRNENKNHTTKMPIGFFLSLYQQCDDMTSRIVALSMNRFYFSISSVVLLLTLNFPCMVLREQNTICSNLCVLFNFEQFRTEPSLCWCVNTCGTIFLSDVCI